MNLINVIKQLKKPLSLLVIIALAISFKANAALPENVDGDKLPSLSKMLKKTMPSIVAIKGFKKVKIDNFNPNQRSDPYNQSQISEQILEQIGSGVIVDADNGYILTNAHVVAELDEINVLLNDNRRFDAKLLGFDKQTDLALLKINADNIQQITFSNSDTLEVGDFVVAIGNPFGFTHTVTSGIVSALGRNNVGFDGYFDFIQTDAAINVGNSGGGLLNLKGELVGINTAIISPPQGGNVGLGFAIPANMARSIMSQLASGGRVNRGPLGVIAQNLTPELAEGFGIKSMQGAVITQVFENTPAYKSRLQIGDVITKVNSKNVLSSNHLRTIISMIPPGQNAEIELYRSGDKRNFRITIENPIDTFEKGEKFFSGLKGYYLELSPREFPIQGVSVTHIDNNSYLNNIDLRVGDLIVGANQAMTPDFNKFKKAAAKNPDILIVQILRQKDTFFVAVKAPKEKTSNIK